MDQVFSFAKSLGYAMLSHFSRVWLCATIYMDCSLLGSSVHGILEAKILGGGGLLCPPPGDLPTQGSKLHLSHLLHWQVGSLPWAPPLPRAWKWKVKVKVAHSCLSHCDPMDRSLPGSSVHGILQARILEWVAIPFSRDDLQDLPIPGMESRSPTLQADSSLSEPPGEPQEPRA